ncbi:MAG: AbrB/MazE/SpoVT family DNA-binding domain-containing protein [Patescibacteria group bacterium]
MATTTLSAKYQIVIPKAVRVKLGLRRGMKVRIYPVDEDRAMIVSESSDIVSELRGLGKEVWQKLGGADKYIKRERASWGDR